MKLRLVSDLHLEFSNYQSDHILLPKEDEKEMVLVLAGDIGCGTMSRHFILEMCARYKYVLMVCGNHEFYGHDLLKVPQEWQEFEDNAPSNFHYLNNDWRLLDGVRFIGGTMWTSFKNCDPIVMMAAEQRMADYGEIKIGGNRLTPWDIYKEHGKFVEFLQSMLDKDSETPTVVITHHSPNDPLKSKGRAPTSLDHCYFAGLDNLIGHAHNIKAWCHGHTHQSQDYLIGETRVVCNPYGYWPSDTNHRFNRTLVIEI